MLALAFTVLTLATSPVAPVCAYESRAPNVASHAARAVECLVNRERAAVGVAPLAHNGLLAGAAQAHTANEIEHNYFAHEDRYDGTLAQRFARAGYSSHARGENIYYEWGGNSTPRHAVEAWMRSQGHRENILRVAFTESGVGVERFEPGWQGAEAPGVTYTQDFGAP